MPPAPIPERASQGIPQGPEGDQEQAGTFFLKGGRSQSQSQPAPLAKVNTLSTVTLLAIMREASPVRLLREQLQRGDRWVTT